MREIKFKAWNKKNKKMISVARFDFADWSVYTHLFGEPIDGLNCEILQYTGLKDIEGKEIYEGDLIEIKTEKHHFVSEIEWNDMVGGFEFQDTQNSWCGLDAIGVFKNGSSIYGGFVKVIGNIYENPELLEVK